MTAAIDDSCRRPGAVPFSWEICPGTPKHVRSSSATVVPSSTFSSTSSKVAVTPKLTPPPSMSPSPYHSPRVSSHTYSYTSSARSASISPSRRRPPPHRPTAFIDVAPRPAVVYRAGAGCNKGHHDEEEEEAGVAYRGCFPLPTVFRRRDRDGKKAGSGGRRSAVASSRSLWSDGAGPVPGGGGYGLRRSASSSSSSCLSLSSGSSNKFAQPREVEAAPGWYF